MITRKNLKIFLTLLLIIAVLVTNQASLLAFAEVTTGTADADSVPTIAAGADITVLGGIHPESELISESIYVAEMRTGIPVYSKNADKKVFPASTTKIMTALVVLENEKDLEKKVSYPNSINDEFHSGNKNKQDPSLAGFLTTQENITVRDVLYGLMLRSGCEAANILAYNVGGGDMNVFFDMMNQKAKEIGCENTNFSNAHGLFEEESYTTAYDMFLITQYALEKHSFFAELVSETEYTMPPNTSEPTGYTIFNSNKLLKISDTNPYYYEFAKGIKTGSVDYYYVNGEEKKGFVNLVSLANRNTEHGAYEYLVVTMNAPWYYREQRAANEDPLHHAYNDHRKLYSWAFSQFGYTRVMQKSESMGEVNVIDGQTDKVKLYPQMEEDFWTLLPIGLDVDSAVLPTVKYDKRDVDAPIEEGAILGTVELKLAGEILAEFDLVTIESVDKTSSAVALDKVKGFFEHPMFKPLAVLIGVLIIALIVLIYIRKHQKQKVRSRKRPPNRKIRR